MLIKHDAAVIVTKSMFFSAHFKIDLSQIMMGKCAKKNCPVPMWLGIVDPPCGKNINIGEKRLVKHTSHQGDPLTDRYTMPKCLCPCNRLVMLKNGLFLEWGGDAYNLIVLKRVHNRHFFTYQSRNFRD